VEKGSTKSIPVMKRAVPASWDTSNSTSRTTRVGDHKISFCNTLRVTHIVYDNSECYWYVST
jgi:hypothetical protein